MTRSGRNAHWWGALALALLGSQPAAAVFHLMQIEQVIGGVCGETSSQAIQLRMRVAGQVLLSLGAQLVAYDAQGLNPVVVIDFMSDVANGAAGSRVLITTQQFTTAGHGPTPDFTMTNPIPASYLAAGRLTFEDTQIKPGTIYWSLAWGGAAYTGSTLGSIDNDDDGDYGPPFGARLPSSTGQALLFQGAAGDQSSSNDVDYALTLADAIFTNNAGASAPVVLGCIFGDGFESGNVSVWSSAVP